MCGKVGLNHTTQAMPTVISKGDGQRPGLLPHLPRRSTRADVGGCLWSQAEAGPCVTLLGRLCFLGCRHRCHQLSASRLGAQALHPLIYLLT